MLIDTTQSHLVSVGKGKQITLSETFYAWWSGWGGGRIFTLTYVQPVRMISLNTCDISSKFLSVFPSAQQRHYCGEMHDMFNRI